MRTLRLDCGVVAFLFTLVSVGSSPGEIVVENHEPNPIFSAVVVGFGWKPPSIYSSDTYFAQTFVAPPNATRLTSVRFTLQSGHTEDSQFANERPFRVLITNNAATAPYRFLPTEILYESPSLISPYTPNPPDVFQNFVVPIPGVSVTPGMTYAFVLDAFSDAVANQYSVRSVQATTTSNFSGGEFYAARLPIDDNLMPIGSRDDHFATQFLPSGPDVDLIFEAKFVPEPGSMTIICVATIPLAWLAYRRRSRYRCK